MITHVKKILEVGKIIQYLYRVNTLDDKRKGRDG